APPPSLPVGDQIRRDHRLAVAGSGGVKNPIEERQSEQAPGSMAVGLGRADEAGKLTVEFGLLGEDPAEHTAHRHRWRLPAPRAEGARLRQRGIERKQQQPGNRDEEQNEMNDRSLPDDGFHGYFTTISLTYAEPILRLGSLCLVPD